MDGPQSGRVMHPQLDEVRREFLSAQQRLHHLADAVPAEFWDQRPGPGRWSVGECVAHLNLTAREYRPLVLAGLEECRRHDDPVPRRYRRDPIGWLIWRTQAPPVRFRARTAAAFVPEGALPPDELIAEFDRLQAEQIGWVAMADGLAIDRVRVTSPFDPRIRYTLFACLSILPRHQHRHLWQAEQVARSVA